MMLSCHMFADVLQPELFINILIQGASAVDIRIRPLEIATATSAPETKAAGTTFSPSHFSRYMFLLSNFKLEAVC